MAHAAPSGAPAARPTVGRHVPDATVVRLPLYLRALHALAGEDRHTISSQELATAAGVGSAKLRKDLSHLGSYGTRGVGYDVDHLVAQISAELGLTSRRAVVLVGVGNLGRALAGYAGFASRGLAVAALLDVDPATVGQEVGGMRVRHLDELPVVVAASGASIGVVATPVDSAQQACDRLVAAGVRSILNFAPVVLDVPPEVDVRKVDLAQELQILAFHDHRKTRLEVAPAGLAPAAAEVGT